MAGTPLIESAIALLKPFKAEVLILTEPLLPCTIEMEPDDEAMLKLGVT